ncbi:uncharacterized protein SPPG_00958 [Spizellomyces punctatus DAOM BR117]|uniref:PHD-type domain-containing protein n=1 Tax=Spizellomyces punctatus (strain DAOM BR117) TaxID=645134 RepID=A0A0L0HRA7_SPIPD|nr:uncharacterized protein SPPG_00958 [Spizellomyces punctatus DAOM BR117]KND03475.1 hypothetical protein SPPG_00958 [Spizellomyces punctatus DAOM BR117]|eukprot:XP_016611514.1 hypothetical protein SPPG_00958 [Spizellomyces punctatus DAOM BR117]
MSAQDEIDDCAICLLPLVPDDDGLLDELGQLDCPTSVHTYHLECLMRWSDVTNTCPKDRSLFRRIRVVERIQGGAKNTIRVVDVEDKVQGVATHLQESVPDDNDVCECMICGHTDREDVMLLCDLCDSGWHMDCLGITEFPEGDWYCPHCHREGTSTTQSSTSTSTTPTRRLVRRRAVSTIPQSAPEHLPAHRPPRSVVDPASTFTPQGRTRTRLINVLRREMQESYRRRHGFSGTTEGRSGHTNYFTPSGSLRDVPPWLATELNPLSEPNWASFTPPPVTLQSKRSVDTPHTSIGSEPDLMRTVWKQFEKARKIAGSATAPLPKRQKVSQQDGHSASLPGSSASHGHTRSHSTAQRSDSHCKSPRNIPSEGGLISENKRWNNGSNGIELAMSNDVRPRKQHGTVPSLLLSKEEDPLPPIQHRSSRTSVEPAPSDLSFLERPRGALPSFKSKKRTEAGKANHQEGPSQHPPGEDKDKSSIERGNAVNDRPIDGRSLFGSSNRATKALDKKMIFTLVKTKLDAYWDAPGRAGLDKTIYKEIGRKVTHEIYDELEQGRKQIEDIDLTAAEMVAAAVGKVLGSERTWHRATNGN